MVIFQYNLYIFVWIQHGSITNTVYAMDPNNSVIKRLWCTLYEPENNKTYNKTYFTSTDSYQHVHPPSMARVLVYPSLHSPEAVEGR